MHRLTAAVFAGSALTLAAGLAWASEPAAAAAARAERCAPGSGGEFRSEAELRKVTESFGYEVVRIGTDGCCYIVRATDRQGKRFDLRFEGANLRMVSRYSTRTEPELVAER